jgi:hypothetical protein
MNPLDALVIAGTVTFRASISELHPIDDNSWRLVAERMRRWEGSARVDRVHK